jgi:hypothetical protein
MPADLIRSSPCRKMLLARCLPYIARRICIHGDDPQADDQIRPGRMP